MSSIKKNLSIIHTYKNALPFSNGGVEKVIDTLATAQASKRHKVTVFATSSQSKNKAISFNGYILEIYKSIFEFASTPISIKWFWKLSLAIRKADVVYLHYPYPLADLVCLLLSNSQKLIIFYHSDIIHQHPLLKFMYEPLKRLTFNRTNVIVYTSPKYPANSATLSRYKRKSFCIPLGIKDYSGQTIIRPDINFDFSKRYLIFIGAARKYKGLDILLRAISELPFPTLFVGGGKDLKKLMNKALEIGATNAHFAGELGEREKHFCIKHSVACVLPSNRRTEAFGLSLLEAAMWSKPLISCEIGTGTSYTNINETTGFVVKPNCHLALRTAILELMTNPEIADKLGRNARIRYEENFVENFMVEGHAALLNKIFAKCE